MRRITVFMVVVAAASACATACLAQTSLYEAPETLTPRGRIDRLVFGRLKTLGIAPARLCSDEVFVRRVYLDVIGTLPTVEETRTFLADKSRDKRSKLIDRLLARDEFADYWAMRWSDVLRIKSEFPINLWPNAVQAYHRWVRTALKENMPYDRFARELLTSSGSNFRVPAVNFYRATQSNKPPALAKAVAQTFMGDRMTSWPVNRRDGLAVFFSRVGFKGTTEWKEQVVYFDLTSKAAPTAVLPDGTIARLPENTDPRAVFADWLITPKNPWFARCAVNRVWYWLLGHGIIHEPDDIRQDNPPSHPEVLAYLEKELVDRKYDLRHLYRLILNSSAYQLSSVPRSDAPRAARMFACYPLRRLDAEVLIDALCRLTGTTEEYSSQIPEPFTWVPTDKRSIALPDGSISSSFLEMFGRPPRDTGMLTERNNKMTAAQVLHLLNSSHVRNKIEKSPWMRSMRRRAWRGPDKVATELYLMILSRYPTREELQKVKAYERANRGKRGGDVTADLAWALLNSSEFLYRH